jgi:hypothetical protein
MQDVFEAENTYQLRQITTFAVVQQLLTLLTRLPDANSRTSRTLATATLAQTPPGTPPTTTNETLGFCDWVTQMR